MVGLHPAFQILTYEAKDYIQSPKSWNTYFHFQTK